MDAVAMFWWIDLFNVASAPFLRWVEYALLPMPMSLPF